MKLRLTIFTCLHVLVALSGCGDAKTDVSNERLTAMAGGKLKEVVPVSGKVLIDGEPAQGVNIYLHKDGGPTPVANTRTSDDGTYCWSTYRNCDGLEPGSYKLGFEHIPNPKKNDTGIDLFKGKFKNPMRNDFNLTVESDSPQTDVDYDLKLK